MNKFENFILDVDGVFTDGKFHYSSDGKVFKIFGDADNDALSILKPKLHIEMVTGDKRGFPITQKRIKDDMGYNVSLVSTFERIDWIKRKFNPINTIYMGDGIYDPLVFKHVGFSIAPANAFYNTKKYANYITNARGGEGAVAEAVVYIIENILNQRFDIFDIDFSSGSGSWMRSNEIPNK
jgi:3-deoxy-D-manno-octulosonate 8-phosphate phosphatase (KDO 8-P phosphatase)